METTFYQLEATANNGQTFPFSDLAGKAVLVVNTASKCGFTPQYTGLEKLYQDYKDQGLVVLGFPCDQFGNQEPGNDEEIGAFCQRNFGVTFPLMKKVDVNGPGTHPVFAWLKAKKGSILGRDIPWNFTKFLVDPQGRVLKRYAPTTSPEALRKDLARVLPLRPAPGAATRG